MVKEKRVLTTEEVHRRVFTREGRGAGGREWSSLFVWQSQSTFHPFRVFCEQVEEMSYG